MPTEDSPNREVQPDFASGTKKQVAELKFLIHDLRVEKFINNIIHFHVTLNADLEIYDIEQAHAFHSDDLAELRVSATHLRRAFRDYYAAVKAFSPDKMILSTGRTYIETIQSICELILNPLWGRYDRVISFLPEDSRSVQSRNHYRNTVRWICGVYYRIEYFFQELDNQDLRVEFDVGDDIIDYTNHVLYGYIVEKGKSRVEIQVERDTPAVVEANKQRFRRMYFNLIMNAVDAMQDQPVGMIKVGVRTDGDMLTLTVNDTGAGMYPEKVAYLLRDRETLDGELHSLGFVFVRQTVEQLGGELQVDSEVGKGTTMTIRFPYLAGREAPPREPSRCKEFSVMPFQEPGDLTDTDRQPRNPPRMRSIASAKVNPKVASHRSPAITMAVGDNDWDPKDYNANCGRIICRDYVMSEAQYSGCIFTIAVKYDLSIDTLLHKPYERLYAINHDDLSPMLYDSAIRGRLEENDDRVAELILKEPHSVAAYFDLKEIEEEGRSKELYVDMIHDEYVLIARKLVATGMPKDIRVHLTSAKKYFGEFEERLGPEPFILDRLAKEPLSTE